MSGRGNEGEEKGRNRDSSRLTQVPWPITLSSLGFLTSQIMCIQHSFLASCLLAMCCFFLLVQIRNRGNPFRVCFKSINQILKFGWLSPSHIPDKFSTSNFVYCSDFYGKYLYQSNINSWVLQKCKVQGLRTSSKDKAQRKDGFMGYLFTCFILFHYLLEEKIAFFLPCCLSRGRICPY